MSDHQKGPPEKEVRPSASEGARANQQASHDTTTTNGQSIAEATDTPEFGCPTGLCPAGVPCTCDFYAGWTVSWPTDHTEPVSVQLSRRRLASYHCPRLASGQRDPISASVW